MNSNQLEALTAVVIALVIILGILVIGRKFQEQRDEKFIAWERRKRLKYLCVLDNENWYLDVGGNPVRKKEDVS